MGADILQTLRLDIRPFVATDLPSIHSVLDQAFGDGSKVHDPEAISERGSWLTWSALSQEWLPRLHQPPYGDRAIVLKPAGVLIGAVGYVPLLDAFEQIPGLGGPGTRSRYNSPEVGLFWAVDPMYQRQGFATEAALAMIDHAFGVLKLRRIIATTEYSNAASQAVMRKVGMQMSRNPLPEPTWLQVVGILHNPL